MKAQKIIFFILMIFFLSSLYAKEITIKEAKQTGYNYLSEKSINNSPEIFLNLLKTEISKGNAVYYIFENTKSPGFIIISADDVFYPVIGYSLQNQYKSENQPANVSNWMQTYVDQIMYLKENNIKATDEITELWNKYNVPVVNCIANKEGKAVDPMTNHITWNQSGGASQSWSEGWNGLCPEDDDGQAVTGCVATAMAIIMYYWQCPVYGSGSHSYYCYPYGTLSANFGETTYMWANMLDDKPTYYSALLQYHAGVSVDMDYSPNGSGTQSSKVVTAMENYFGYETTGQFQRYNYTDTQWKNNILKPELDAGRPFYYSGSNDEVGHGFVCDGYDDSDLFHFNWGWGGLDNGYYNINDMNSFTNWNAVIYINPGQDSLYLDTVESITGTINLSNTDNFQVDLEWTAPIKVEKSLSGYDLYRGETLIEEDLPASTLTYSDIITSNDDIDSYYYAVRAVYTDGMALCVSDYVDADFDLTFNFEDTDGNPVTMVYITLNGEVQYSSFLSFYKFTDVLFGWDYDVTVEHSGYETLNDVLDIVNRDGTYTVVLGESITLSAEELIENSNEKITIYPNPSAAGIFYIQNLNEKAVISVSDISGKIIYQSQLHNNHIDLSDQPKGIYIMNINTNQETIVKKIIIE